MILYGIHPVEEALLAGRRKIIKIYVSNRKSSRILKIVDRAESSRIPVEFLSADKLCSLAGTGSHQGVGAQIEGFPFSDPGRIMATDSSGLVLVLDGLMDPHNVGALIRTALCVGVTGIILPKDRSVSMTPAVSMASAGALEHIRLARVTNISGTLMQLKSAGLWVAGLVPLADQSIFEADLSGPLALVVGSEEKGIRPLVKKKCDFLVSIPQQGKVDSLNVSVAGAVALYETFRQRQAMTAKTGHR